MGKLKTNRIGVYDHLNRGNEFMFEFDIDEVAAQICSRDYGTHRLLSAIVRYRDGRDAHWRRPDELADGIRDLLDRGLF